MPKKPNDTMETQETQRSRLLLTHALKLINAPLVVEERLHLLAKIIADYLKVDDVGIFLKEQNENILVMRTSVGLDQTAVGNIRIPIGTGITGRVAETRKYIATRNINKDPRNFYSMLSEDEKYPAILSFPILSGDDLLGVVNIRSKEERDFSEREAEELNNFTAGIAGSIINAQTHERLEYKSRLLELSIKIAGSVTSTLDIDEILEDVAWEIGTGFNLKGVIIHLMDKDGSITKTGSFGLKKSFVRQYPLDIAQSCVMSGEPKIRRIESDDADHELAIGNGWNICLPLISRNRNLGVISLFGLDESSDDPEGLFLSIGVDVLLHIAGLAALAIDNATIHSRLRHLADEEKKKLDVIGLMYSRVSAVFDSISDGVVGVDEHGVIHDFNEVAGKMLGLSRDANRKKKIDELTSYKPPLSTLIADGKELTNRVVTFITPSDKFAALATMRSYADPSGEQRGSVISFRPMKETVKMLSRFSSQRPKYVFDDIIGHDTSLAETVKLAKIAAQSNSNILIVGDSGTGKELFSQAIHNASPVADGPFIPVNCAAIPSDLIESELFGYEEGAFTGARKGGYIGKFEQATGGTIFLDEIGDMPLDLQVKLLRVLQEKVIQRVGSEHIIPISTRVIAATNRDLKKAISEGKFREELYWRLNVITIEIPPLRDRKIDLKEFIEFFIAKFAQANGKDVKTIDQESLKRLMEYSWSGNVRELENAVEHAVLVVQSDTITWNDLPTSLRERYEDEKSARNAPGIIEQVRRERTESSVKLYREALLQAGGNVDAAARKLGMSRATLYRRLKKYGITGEVSKIRQNVKNDTAP